MTRRTDNGQVLLGGHGASARLARLDPAFAPLRKRFGPAKVDADREPFEALISAICNQQMSIAAGRTIFGRIETLAGGRITPGTIDRAGDDELRACGLSRPKVGYVRGLADAVLEGSLDLHAIGDMDDHEAIETLVALKGIGRWTAEVLLIFTFHRPDVLPTDDLGLLDAVKYTHGRRRRATPRSLERMARAWRPYRSVAAWYLWMERDRVVR